MKNLIVRLKPHRTAQPALENHVSGRSPAESSIPRDGVPEYLPLPGVGPQETAAARRWLDHVRAQPKRGKPGIEAVDVFVGGPPPMLAPNAWTLDKVKRWSELVMDTFRRVLPGEPLFLDGAVHLGETAPHIQFMFVPRIDGRNSWRHAQAHMAEALVPGAGELRRPAQLSKMQSGFYREFGEPVGLGRGEIGSKAKHLPPDREKGYELRLKYEEQATAAAVKSADDAIKAADERAADAHGRADERAAEAERRADERVRAAEERMRKRENVFKRRAMLARQEAERKAQKSDLAGDERGEHAREAEERCMRVIQQLQAEDREQHLQEMRDEREKRERDAAKRREAARRELEQKHRAEKPEDELTR